jgi:hypothetical protein
MTVNDGDELAAVLNADESRSPPDRFAGPGESGTPHPA